MLSFNHISVFSVLVISSVCTALLLPLRNGIIHLILSLNSHDDSHGQIVASPHLKPIYGNRRYFPVFIMFWVLFKKAITLITCSKIHQTLFSSVFKRIALLLKMA